jgi:hypothetical protein
LVTEHSADHRTGGGAEHFLAGDAASGRRRCGGRRSECRSLGDDTRRTRLLHLDRLGARDAHFLELGRRAQRQQGKHDGYGE